MVRRASAIARTRERRRPSRARLRASRAHRADGGGSAAWPLTPMRAGPIAVRRSTSVSDTAATARSLRRVAGFVVEQRDGDDRPPRRRCRRRPVARHHQRARGADDERDEHPSRPRPSTSGQSSAWRGTDRWDRRAPPPRRRPAASPAHVSPAAPRRSTCTGAMNRNPRRGSVCTNREFSAESPSADRSWRDAVGKAAIEVDVRVPAPQVRPAARRATPPRLHAPRAARARAPAAARASTSRSPRRRIIERLEREDAEPVDHGLSVSLAYRDHANTKTRRRTKVDVVHSAAPHDRTVQSVLRVSS